MHTQTDWLVYGLQEYLIYALIYSLLAVPLFYFFWRWGQGRFARWRIQTRRWATPAMLTGEVKNSLMTFGVFALIDVGLYAVQLQGYTQIYTDVAAYGWWYLVGSVGLMLVIHDTYFYWMHRLMHHPALFRHVHQVHHQSIDPSPLAAFSFHPLEAVAEAGIYVLLSFLLPVHLFALFGFQVLSTLLNVLGHLGYEIYPAWFTRNRPGSWKTTSTHHNMHHARFRGNYGLYFTWWDTWMGTEFSDYTQAVGEIHQRKAADATTQVPFLCIALLLISLKTSVAQSIPTGIWLVQDRSASVSIVAQGGQLTGQINWLNIPLDLKTGQPVLDLENPDPGLRTRPLLGLVMLWGFVKKGAEWQVGTIYDPTVGKTYRGKLWLDVSGQVLTVRGYAGPFFRTELWTKQP